MLFAAPAASAQSAYYAGAISTLGGEIAFNYPFSVALDSAGNVYVAATNSNAVYEIVAGTGGAAAGTVNVGSTVNTIGSGFSQPTGVAVDSVGNVYVTDTNHSAVKEIVAGTGGAAAGTVNANSTVKTLGSGFLRPEGVAVDAKGNVYVDDSGNNEVKEIVAGTGTVNTLASGFSSPIGVAVDSAGNVYVPDQNNNELKEIVAGTGGAAAGTVNSNSKINILGNFKFPTGVAVDGAGNVYVAFDSLTTPIEEIVAGTGGAAAGTVSASSTVKTLGSGFNTPLGVAVDAKGNVYVADSGNSAVKEIQLSTAQFGALNVGTTSSTVLVPFTFTANATVSSVSVLTQGATGKDYTQAATGTTCTATAYTAGQSCSVAVTFTPKFPGQRLGAVVLNTSSGPAGTALLTGSGTGPLLDFSTVSGTPASYNPSATNILGSNFKYPYSMTVDASGNVFVADTNNNAVKEIEAGTGGAAAGTVITIGSNFQSPNGVAVDARGNIFVADFGPYPNLGNVKEIEAGTGGAAAGTVNANSTVITVGSGFNFPNAVAVDASGNVFVADLGLIPSSNLGSVKEIEAGTGGATAGTVNANSTVITLGSGFNSPAGVAVDANGNVFVADSGNNAIKEIEAGTGGAAAGTVNANSTVITLGSGFNSPTGVAVDASGNVIVAGYNSNLVNEIEAGTGGAATGTVNANSTVITLGSGFNGPTGVAVDASGNVYVADTSNSVVKELTYATPPSLTFANTNVGTTSATQTVLVQNIGNAGLTFPISSSGNNPSVATNFGIGNSTTCPTLTASSGSAGLLGPGATCNLLIDFAPTTSGSLTGAVTLFDTNLNANPSVQQTISVSGTGVAVATASGIVYPSTQTGVAATPQSANFTIPSGKTVASVMVVTQGMQNLDFTEGSGSTCASGSSGACTVVVNFTPKAPGLRLGAAIVTLSDGTTLTNFLSGLGEGPELQFQPGAMSTVAGSGQPCYGTTGAGCGDGTNPLAASFTHGNTIIYDAAGNAYVADLGAVVVRKITPAGVVSTIAGKENQGCQPAGAACGDGGPATSATMLGPSDMAIDGAGNLYLSDKGDNRVRVVNLITGTINAYAGTGATCSNPSAANSCGDGGPALSATMGSIDGMAVDAQGNVYIGDTNDYKIRKVNQSTGIITTIGGNGTFCTNLTGTCGDGGLATAAQINYPNKLRLDSQGNIYFADATANRAREINVSTGVISTVAGNGSVCGSPTSACGDGGLATNAQIGTVWGLALDGADNLYVVDNNDNKIRFVNHTTGIISTVVGNGQTCAAPYMPCGDGGNGAQAELNGPVCVAFNPQGNIDVCDNSDYRIRQLSFDASNLSFASTNVGATSTDSPQSITIVNAGNAPLIFPVPATGTNPSIAAGFAIDSNSQVTTCPVVTTSGTASNIVIGGSCSIGVDFTPTLAGTNDGSLVLTDNNFGLANQTQTVSLSGTGIVTVSQLVFTGSPAATVTAGGNAGSAITVSEENASSNVVTAATDTITLTVTGPGGYSKTYTATAVNGVATFNLSAVPLTSAGAYTYSATISGNTSITAGTASETVSSGTASTTTASQGATQSAVIGAAFSTALQVQVTDAYSNPVGGVVVSFTPPATGASAVLSAASCTTSMTAPVGVCSVTATANGTASATAYMVMAKAAGATAGASFALTNLKATPTVTMSEGSSTLVYGQAESLTASFAPASVAGTTPTAGMLFYDNGSQLSTAAVSSGSAKLTNLYPAAGVHTYAASYPGDTNFNASAKATATPNVTVTKATTTLTTSQQSISLADGQSGSIPVAVAGQYSGAGIATPSATVTYSIVNASGVTVATGTVTLTSGAGSVPVPSTLAPGTYTVDLSYGGDGNYAASTTPVAVQLVVNQIQPTINWVQPAAISYGTSLSGVLNAVAMNGTTVVPGTMTYTAMAAGGSATAVSEASVLAAGTYTLTATFTPTSTTMYKTATASVSLVVNKAAAGISLTTSANTVLVQNPVTFTATVASVAGIPTGTVSFFDGSTTSTPIGAAALANGMAVLTTSALSTGTHTITAVYSGDSNHVAATSPALVQTVQDFNLTISTSTGGATTATVVPGGTASYVFTLSPTGATTFPANVALSVNGLPTGATYTLSPTSIQAGSGPTNVTLKVLVPNATMAALHHKNRPMPGKPTGQPWGRGLAPIALGVLLLPFTRRMRKMGKRMGRAVTVALLLMVGLGTVAGLSGCGTTTGYFGQPEHTYTVSITGTSGALVHSTTVTLNVQ